MSGAHSPSEWAQMVSLAVALYAACSSPYFLLVEAEVWAWPRPLVAAVERAQPNAQRAGDRLLVHVANARVDAREMAAEARVYIRLSVREAAVSTAALLALFTINPGVTR